MLFSGGLVLGAVYMATDMVTSPVTRRARGSSARASAARRADPHLGRPAGRRDVRDPADERAGAVHQPRDAPRVFGTARRSTA
jgi:hypothetical protein